MFKFFSPTSECFAKYDAFCSHIFDYACLRRKTLLQSKGFEIMEKLYTSKTFLKVAGRRMQGRKSVLSIGGMIQQNRPFFDIGGDDLQKLIIFRYWGDVNWLVWGIFYFYEKYWGEYIPPGFSPIGGCIPFILSPGHKPQKPSKESGIVQSLGTISFVLFY